MTGGVAGLGRRTASNAVLNILPFGLGFVLNLVVVAFVVRRIGVADFGLFGLFAALLTPLTLANLGFGEATVKYVAEHAHRGDLEGAARYVRTTLTLNLAVGVVGALLLALAGPSLAVGLFHVPPESRPMATAAVRWLALAWLGNQAGAVFLAVAPAMQRFRLVAAGQAVVLTAGAVASVALVALGLGLPGYALGTAIGSLTGAVVWFGIARTLLPGQDLRPRIDRQAWQHSLSFGGWQAVAQLGGLASAQSEKLLLGFLVGPAAIGLYQIAQTLAQRIYSSVFKMSEVLFPLFSTMSHDSRERRAELLLRTSWLLTTLSVAVLVPLVALAEPLLRVWIGESVARDGATVLQLLAVAGVLGCATNASFFMLLGMGNTRWTAGLSIATGVVTLVVAAVAIPHLGVAGAGVGAIAAMLVQQALIGFFMLPRVLGSALRPGDLFLSLHLPVILGLAVTFAWLYFGPVTQGVTGVLAAYAGLAVLSFLASLGAGTLLPGGQARVRDVATVLALPFRPPAP